MRSLTAAISSALAKAAAMFAPAQPPQYVPVEIPRPPQTTVGQAHVKRLARKRKNQQRNRSAHRG